MTTRNFALISGLVMVSMGILALVPNLNGSAESLPVLYMEDSYGLFLNIFPMNILNKIALIFFGVFGMFCYFISKYSHKLSCFFAKTIFWFMGTLAILGLFPATNTLSGFWPLFGPEVFLHGSLSVFGLYFGFMAIREEYGTLHRRHGRDRHHGNYRAY